MFLPDDAMSKGATRDGAAILLSVIGIANTIGRVGCGWVSDQSWADCLIINNGALMMGGAATVCVPFLQGNYYLLCVYSVLFGLSIGKNRRGVHCTVIVRIFWFIFLYLLEFPTCEELYERIINEFSAFEAKIMSDVSEIDIRHVRVLLYISAPF